MINYSADPVADDFSIRCRVRRSKCALEPEFDEAREMTCIMRHSDAIFGTYTPPTKEDASHCSSSFSNSNILPSKSARRSSFTEAAADQAAAISALLGGGGGGGVRGKGLLLRPVHAVSIPPRTGSTSTPSIPVPPLPLHGDEPRFRSFGLTQGGAAATATATATATAPVSDIIFRAAIDDSELEVGEAASLASASLSSMGTATVSEGRSPTRPRERRGRSSQCRSVGEMPIAPLNEGKHRLSQARQVSAPSSSASSFRSRSTGRRTLSLPRTRPSAAAAFAVGGGGTACADKIDPARNDLSAPQSYHIPLSDVMVVDVDGISSKHNDFSARKDCRMNVTTLCHGFFEFVFQSKNAHDVLLAFLQASIPAERITNGPSLKVDSSASDRAFIANPSSACCDSQDSYDMDGFTAREMNESVERERLGDRLRRRFIHIAAQLQDLSFNLSECFCSGNDATIATSGSKKAVRSSFPGTPKSTRRVSSSMHTSGNDDLLGISEKLSVEHTPRNAAEGDTSSCHARHVDIYRLSPEATTCIKLSTPPIDSGFADKEDSGQGSITPVGTSESEEEDSEKHEEYGHDESDPKLLSVYI